MSETTNIEVNRFDNWQELEWPNLKAGDHFVYDGRLGMKLSHKLVWYWDGLYVCTVVPATKVAVVKNVTLNFEMS